jgi:NAD(P)-dependent dehydrogenase (short-subunit alcohol dehydrogenase family)
VILDLFKLTDRVAIVTGAGKGIGRGIALAFAEAGADVVCAARTRADVDATAAAVRERGRRALAVETDVMKTEDLERLVAAAIAEFGRLDVLVNNAGGTAPRAALQTSERYFETALRFNVTSAFLLTRLAVPKMVETTGGGAIVNISSRASDMVQTSFVAYAAGKAALNMITRNLAAEFAPKVRDRDRRAPGGADRRRAARAVRGQHADGPRRHGRGHRRLRALPRLASRRLGDGQDLPGGRRDRVPGDQRPCAEALSRCRGRDCQSRRPAPDLAEPGQAAAYRLRLATRLAQDARRHLGRAAHAVVDAFLGRLLGFYGPGQGAGFIASIVAALIVLFVYGRLRGSRA